MCPPRDLNKNNENVVDFLLSDIDLADLQGKRAFGAYRNRKYFLQ